MARRAAGTCRWADIALLGVVINLVVLVVAPLVRPDLNVVEHPPSYYAVGPWAVLQWVAFGAIGVASLALAITLGRSMIISGWLRICLAALVIAGIASLGLVGFPMDRPSWHTPIGDLHQTSGTIGGVAQLVAALSFALAIRNDQRWSGLFGPAILAFGIALAGAIISQISLWRPDLDLPMGAAMRLVVAPLVLLWGLVAWRLRQACQANATRSTGAK